MVSNKLNLFEVQQQIHNWLINKEHNNVAMPAEIRKTLGLSGSQYKQLKKNDISNKCKDSEQKNQIFKKIILPPINISNYQAIIENKNGCKLTLQLSSINELTFIITNFVEDKNYASICIVPASMRR